MVQSTGRKEPRHTDSFGWIGREEAGQVAVTEDAPGCSALRVQTRWYRLGGGVRPPSRRAAAVPSTAGSGAPVATRAVPAPWERALPHLAPVFGELQDTLPKLHYLLLARFLFFSAPAGDLGATARLLLSCAQTALLAPIHADWLYATPKPGQPTIGLTAAGSAGAAQWSGVTRCLALRPGFAPSRTEAAATANAKDNGLQHPVPPPSLCSSIQHQDHRSTVRSGPRTSTQLPGPEPKDSTCSPALQPDCTHSSGSKTPGRASELPDGGTPASPGHGQGWRMVTRIGVWLL
ncbi:uncharacterized protein [Saccopteryx bilineata]|uniref:uncharacterized protein n=1 Tax=Saccopteryx bilineata TaxID=59482 RepID=UPI00338E7FD6